MTSSPFRRLEAWQASRDLYVSLYRVTAAWPKQELYGLTSQTGRAAYSIAANLAEGSAKRGAREFRRFVDIRLGFLAELECALELARDVGILPPERWSEIEGVRRRAGALCWRLAASLRQSEP